MRVAIVHYWFLLSGGGERVVEALANMYPQADLFALFADRGSMPESLRDRKLTTSFLNNLPLAHKINRLIFPLYPLAAESFDLQAYDLVISSDSPSIKGLMLNQSAVHLCYCHTPARPLWDNHSEARRQRPPLIRPFFSAGAHYVRKWDFCSAQRVDRFIANSQYISQRIAKYYRRESVVVYPPVEISKGYLSPTQDDYYLTVGRLVDTKRVDLLIQACNKLRKRLVIAGSGREMKRLKTIAGPNIEFLGRVADSELSDLYARARAFLFAADEDFGIAPVEAQSYGRPVICFGQGGSLETVRGHGVTDQPTGLFFQEQTVVSICNAIQQFETIEDDFRPNLIQNHVRQFDLPVFEKRMRRIIDTTLHAENEIANRRSDLTFTTNVSNLSRAVVQNTPQLVSASPVRDLDEDE
ncbi:MAG TPA: glycosyltransferase [Bryobacteraceae bacterium]|jgi:glycosyltransferase involved in cell wall biosynthesis|nr:glycosyltransferase [Bryobacteraceae bacterium]